MWQRWAPRMVVGIGMLAGSSLALAQAPAAAGCMTAGEMPSTIVPLAAFLLGALAVVRQRRDD